MELRPLGRTGLEIAPLVFGGNVFGWTADEKASFGILDAFVDAGFNAIDTADVYSRWAEGNSGGESEAIIGNWLKANPAKRDKVVIITKVGADVGQGRKDLSERWITEAVENSLRRLQTDYIDLYLSHWPDPETPYEETLGAYDKLLKAGKIRNVGASNLDAGQLSDSLKVATDKGLPRYDVLQPEYNLYDREGFEGPLCDLVQREEIGVITYFSLASGFLSGKYRSAGDVAASKRSKFVEKYMNARGQRILKALDDVAAHTGATQAEIAIAWLIARPGVTAPIVSATDREQLASLFKATELDLGPAEMKILDTAGA